MNNTFLTDESKVYFFPDPLNKNEIVDSPNQLAKLKRKKHSQAIRLPAFNSTTNNLFIPGMESNQQRQSKKRIKINHE